MTLAELRWAGRSPQLPISIELEDAAGPASLTLEKLLRVLPGQRYVGVAEWRGRKVLAKLLVGGKAARAFQRELHGARLLAGQGLPTPRLLADGLREGEGGWLLFEYFDNAQGLGDVWRVIEHQALLSDDQQALLGEALGLVARMHSQGLWQADLHLDNLLRHDSQLHVIDGGGVCCETPGEPLSRTKVLENLGVFFGQLPASLDAFIEELLVHYLLVNGAHALPLEALLKEIGKVRRWRLRDYLRKIGRDCSLFSARRGASVLRVVRREDESRLAPLLADLDTAISAGQPLKLGGTSTVALVEQAGRPLVVKRYNIKGFAHWLKRFWRPTRAWHSWAEGNRLDFLGIATPRPLALLELRTLWLRRRAYLITEYATGEDIIARFRPCLDAPGESSSPSEADLQALDQLFAALLRERISHGDLKGSNLLWDEGLQDGRWVLIDLDSMQQHHSTRRFAKAYARDRARFLRNWPADSGLFKLLDERLPQVPGTCPE